MNLEQRVERLESKVADMETSIRDNTKVTKSIKEDTQELIALIKGTRLLAAILKWGAGLAAAIGVLWSVLRGWKV